MPLCILNRVGVDIWTENAFFLEIFNLCTVSGIVILINSATNKYFLLLGKIAAMC